MCARRLCQLTEGVQITLPYTVAVFMVRAFLLQSPARAASAGHTGGVPGGLDEEEVGWMTGILVQPSCSTRAFADEGGVADGGACARRRPAGASRNS